MRKKEREEPIYIEGNERKVKPGMYVENGEGYNGHLLIS